MAMKSVSYYQYLCFDQHFSSPLYSPSKCYTRSELEPHNNKVNNGTSDRKHSLISMQFGGKLTKL